MTAKVEAYVELEAGMLDDGKLNVRLTLRLMSRVAAQLKLRLTLNSKLGWMLRDGTSPKPEKGDVQFSLPRHPHALLPALRLGSVAEFGQTSSVQSGAQWLRCSFAKLQMHR